MKIKNYLTIMTVLVVLLMTSGCNMFKSLDKPTDAEDAKYKEQKAIENKDYDALIASLLNRLSTLTGEERLEAIQTLGDANLAKAGVNIVDIAIDFSETDTTTSSSVSDNQKLVQTLNNLDFNALEEADKYYDELDGNGGIATSIKRGSSGNTYKKDYYLSAAITKALLAARYIAIVMYEFEPADRMLIDITDDGTAVAYKVNNDGTLSEKAVRTDSAIKDAWVAINPAKNKTYGNLIVNNLYKATNYLTKALDLTDDDESSDIKNTVDDFYKDIAVYGDKTSASELGEDFIDLIDTYRP